MATVTELRQQISQRRGEISAAERQIQEFDPRIIQTRTQLMKQDIQRRVAVKAEEAARIAAKKKAIGELRVAEKAFEAEAKPVEAKIATYEKKVRAFEKEQKEWRIAQEYIDENKYPTTEDRSVKDKYAILELRVKERVESRKEAREAFKELREEGFGTLTMEGKEVTGIMDPAMVEQIKTPEGELIKVKDWNVYVEKQKSLTAKDLPEPPEFKRKELRSTIGDLYEGIKEMGKDVYKTFDAPSFISGTKAMFTDIFVTPYKDIKSSITGTSKKPTDFYSGVKEIVKPLALDIKDVKAGVGDITKDVGKFAEVPEIISGLKSFVKPVRQDFPDVISGLKDFSKPLRQDLPDVISGVKAMGRDVYKTLGEIPKFEELSAPVIDITTKPFQLRKEEREREKLGKEFREFERRFMGTTSFQQQQDLVSEYERRWKPRGFRLYLSEDRYSFGYPVWYTGLRKGFETKQVGEPLVPFLLRKGRLATEEAFTDIGEFTLFKDTKLFAKVRQPEYLYQPASKYIGKGVGIGVGLGVYFTPYVAPIAFLGGTAEVLATRPQKFIQYAKEEPFEVGLAATYGIFKGVQFLRRPMYITKAGKLVKKPTWIVKARGKTIAYEPQTPIILKKGGKIITQKTPFGYDIKRIYTPGKYGIQSRWGQLFGKKPVIKTYQPRIKTIETAPYWQRQAKRYTVITSIGKKPKIFTVKRIGKIQLPPRMKRELAQKYIEITTGKLVPEKLARQYFPKGVKVSGQGMVVISPTGIKRYGVFGTSRKFMELPIKRFYETKMLVQEIGKSGRFIGKPSGILGTTIGYRPVGLTVESKPFQTLITLPKRYQLTPTLVTPRELLPRDIISIPTRAPEGLLRFQEPIFTPYIPFPETRFAIPPLPVLRDTTILKTIPIFKQFEISEQDQIIKQIQVPKTIQVPRVVQIPRTFQIPRQAPILFQAPAIKQIQIPKQVQVPKVIQIQRPVQIQQPVQKPLIPVPIIIPPLTETRGLTYLKRIAKKMTKAYEVQVRRGEVFRVISKKPLPLGKALKLGAERVTTTLAATFRLKEKGVTTLADIPYKPSPLQFRAPKVPAKLTFVERKPLRIKKGTGEIAEILMIRGKKKRRKGKWL